MANIITPSDNDTYVIMDNRGTDRYIKKYNDMGYEFLGYYKIMLDKGFELRTDFDIRNKVILLKTETITDAKGANNWVATPIATPFPDSDIPLSFETTRRKIKKQLYGNNYDSETAYRLFKLKNNTSSSYIPQSIIPSNRGGRRTKSRRRRHRRKNTTKRYKRNS